MNGVARPVRTRPTRRDRRRGKGKGRARARARESARERESESGMESESESERVMVREKEKERPVRTRQGVGNPARFLQHQHRPVGVDALEQVQKRGEPTIQHDLTWVRDPMGGWNR